MAVRAMSWPLRLALTLLAAGLLALAFEPFALAPLAWVGMVPFLLAISGARPSLARTLGFIFGLTFYGLTVHWLFRIFGAAAVALIAILAAGPWLLGAAYALLERRVGVARALLLSPIVWVGLDLFRSELWYFRFSWMQLGFSQVAAPAILQLAGVVGVYGLTLLIVLANALLALALLRWRPSRSLPVAALVVVATVLLSRLPAPRHVLGPGAFRVGAVQSEASDLDTNLRLTDTACRAGARLVAWPEYSLYDGALSDPAILPRLRAAARAGGIYLVVGNKERVPGRSDVVSVFYNAALVISPRGEVLGSYHKHYPVQFFHDGRPGRGFPTFATPWGPMGVAICYDLDFSPVLRHLAWRGASFFVVPTYDALSWGALQHRQHSAMACARAVEHRRYILRPTSSGLTQVIDPWGLTYATNIGTETALVGVIAPMTRLTVCDRVGWAIPYACLALTLLGFVGSLTARALPRPIGGPRNGASPI